MLTAEIACFSYLFDFGAQHKPFEYPFTPILTWKQNNKKFFQAVYFILPWSILHSYVIQKYIYIYVARRSPDLPFEFGDLETKRSWLRLRPHGDEFPLGPTRRHARFGGQGGAWKQQIWKEMALNFSVFDYYGTLLWQIRVWFDFQVFHLILMFQNHCESYCFIFIDLAWFSSCWCCTRSKSSNWSLTMWSSTNRKINRW